MMVPEILGCGEGILGTEMYFALKEEEIRVR